MVERDSSIESMKSELQFLIKRLDKETLKGEDSISALNAALALQYAIYKNYQKNNTFSMPIIS